MESTGKNKTVAIDFDGVVCNKADGTPIAGARQSVVQLLAEYEVIIFTARHDTERVANWLEDNFFPKLKVVNRKPVAFAYLDDHAIRFEGNWDYALREIEFNQEGWQDGDHRGTQKTESGETTRTEDLASS